MCVCVFLKYDRDSHCIQKWIFDHMQRGIFDVWLFKLTAPVL